MKTYTQLIFPIILLCILTMRFTKLNAQNVGINTLTPQMPLHVKSPTSEMEVLRLESANQYGSFLSIWNNMERKGFLGIVGNQNDIKLGTYTTGGKIQFMTEITNPAMTILSDGKVGIGTENPTELLDLDGNLNLGGQIKLYGVAGLAGQVLQADGSGNMSWTTMSGGSTDAITDADGDTKIQVEENPDEDIIRFDVAGNERVTIGEGLGTISSNTNVWQGHAVEGIATSLQGRGVHGTATGTDGRAVEGIANNSTATKNYGGYFQANAIQGAGATGIGTGTSGFGVVGHALNSSASFNYGGYFTANGSSGRGVYGSASGSDGQGVYGVATGTSGRAIEGRATNSGNVTNYGGYFEANGTDGIGVYGRTTGTTGIAVHGIADNTSGTYNIGGKFESNGPGGYAVVTTATGLNAFAVHGFANNSASIINFGGYFLANGSSGRGCSGGATGTNGIGGYFSASGSAGKGIYATTNGLQGRAVEGIANNSANSTIINYGGYFSASSKNGRGVSGIATGTTGHAGYFSNSTGSSGVGIYATGNGYAGFFSGDVYVSGTFTNPSDIRFKKNIVRNQKFLDKVMRLDPVTYEFDNNKFKTMRFSEGIRHGFIAQELELIYPELVSNKQYQINVVDPDSKEAPIYEEFKSVNYMDLIPDLVGAIQEQQEIIEQLKSQVASLEAIVKSKDEK